MNKIYESPEFEVLLCEMVEDVIMASIENTVPDQEVTTSPAGGDEPPEIDLDLFE